MTDTDQTDGADGPGIEFTETMRGWASTEVTDEYEAAAERGEEDDSPLEVTVTVRAPDVDRMIEDRDHEAVLEGEVRAPALSSEPLAVEWGRFNLLVRDPEHPRTRKMVYRMRLEADDGTPFFLEGFKAVRDDPGPDLWSDTTTLYVTVHEGESAEGPVAARGIIRIHLNDFRKQLGTMKVVGAGSKLEELRTLGRFGRFFTGALSEIYGGVFARRSDFAPDAPPRERRTLSCDPPEIHWFETGDGVPLKLTRYEGGSRGPVILSPGFGTSARAFTLDTTEQNLPEHLFEHGYDVWVLDYRASPDLESSETRFTLDDIARYDYPAAVEAVLEESGADSVQLMAHCVGSLTMLMSMALGLEGVRSAVASQLTFHPRVGPLNKIRSGAFVADALTTVGVDTLTTDVDERRGWAEKLYDTALRLYPAGRERCASPVCRRILFMYGEVFDHDQLNDATHEALHEVFGVANLETLKQISRAIRAGHVVTADGEDVYLPAADRLDLPITFIHGENNRLFLPEGSRVTYEHLRQENDPELYRREVIPDYAHMDCFIGKNAARDVYPLVRAELDRYN